MKITIKIKRSAAEEACKQRRAVKKKKMPNGIAQILKCVLAYVVINALLSLFIICFDASVDSLSSFFEKFGNMFLYALANALPDSVGVIAKAAKTISDIIILAIIGGYVYSLIMSLHLGIVIPDNLILRRSPQDDDNGKPMLSFMLGNKSKYYRFDVSCEITCVFQKQLGNPSVHTQMIERQSVSMINNYYRFSFDASKIPTKFWKNYSEYLENGWTNKLIESDNHVAVLVSGSSNFLGGRFTILKEYPLSKIIFNDEKPDHGAHGFREDNGKIHWDKFKAWPCGACSNESYPCRGIDSRICAEIVTKRSELVGKITSDGKASDNQKSC